MQLKQMTQQMDTYQAVIVKMRDMVNNTKVEKQELSRALEEARKECDQLQLEFERKSTELSGAKTIINDLHEQVDAALGATRMVDNLTAKNLDLEDALK